MSFQNIINKINQEQITNNSKWDNIWRNRRVGDVYVFVDGAYSDGDKFMVGAADINLIYQNQIKNESWTTILTNDHYIKNGWGGIASEACAVELAIEILDKIFSSIQNNNWKANRIYIFADNQEIVLNCNLFLNGVQSKFQKSSQPIQSMIAEIRKTKYKDKIKVIRMSRELPQIKKVHNSANNRKQAAR